MAVTDQVYFANRRAEMARYVEQDAHNNTSYKGVIHSVSPLNKLQGTCEVFIHRLQLTVKADISAGGYFRGDTVNYRPGDTVIVEFINGKSERPIVTGLAPRHNNELTILEGEVPQQAEKAENGSDKYPYPTASPEAVIPGAVKRNYDVTGHVVPIQLDNESFGINYLPATAIWSAQGNYYIYPASDMIVKATHQRMVIAAPEGTPDPVLAPFADLESLEVDPRLTHRLKIVDPTDPDSMKDYVYKDDEEMEILFDPLLPMSQKLFPMNGSQEAVTAAQGISSGIQAIEGCIDSNIDSIGGIIGQIIKALIPLALEQLNSVLPDSLQVSVDENGNVIVGPVSFDPTTGNVTFDGKVFTGIVTDRLSSVIDMVPDFLGLKQSGSILSVGDATVDMSTMEVNGSVTVAGLTISKQSGGDVVVNFDDTVVGRIVDAAYDGVLGKPVSELNKSLPPEMQVSVGAGANGLPILGVGPLTLDFSNGFESIEDIVTLDMGALLDIIGGQLNNLFGNLIQLPKPIMMVAQALWEELNIGGLIMGLIQGLLGEVMGSLFGEMMGLPEGAGGKIDTVIGSASYTCASAFLPSFSNNGPVIVSPGSFSPENVTDATPGGPKRSDPIAPPAGRKPESTPIAPAAGKK
jgi:hypothetical protein